MPFPIDTMGLIIKADTMPVGGTCMKKVFIGIALILIVIGPAIAQDSSKFTSNFPVDKNNLASVGENPYFILQLAIACISRARMAL